MPVKDPERVEEAEPEDGRVTTVTDALRTGIGGTIGGLVNGRPFGTDEDAEEIARNARDEATLAQQARDEAEKDS